MADCFNCSYRYLDRLTEYPCTDCQGFSMWRWSDNTASIQSIVESQHDPINHPPHYKHGGIETIDIIRMALTDDEFRGYCKGNILKYRERAQFKGNAEQDYKKAEWYYKKLQEV